MAKIIKKAIQSESEACRIPDSSGRPFARTCTDSFRPGFFRSEKSYLEINADETRCESSIFRQHHLLNVRTFFISYSSRLFPPLWVERATAINPPGSYSAECAIGTLALNRLFLSACQSVQLLRLRMLPVSFCLHPQVCNRLSEP